MYRYKKITAEGYSLYASEKLPKNMNGLIEISEEEYNELLAALENTPTET